MFDATLERLHMAGDGGVCERDLEDIELSREYAWAQRTVDSGLLNRILPHYTDADAFREKVLRVAELEASTSEAHTLTRELWERALRKTRQIV